MSLWVYDTEIYWNYFIFGAKNIETGKVWTIEFAEGEVFDREALRRFLKGKTLISFNGINFDQMIIAAALAGRTTEEIKEVANAIIESNLKYWEIEREFKLKRPEFDHIDLIEVAPGKVSLKLYNGRLHGPRMQDLPIEPDARLTARQMDDIADYLVNDLDATERLYRHLEKQIALRASMGEEYGLDLRSKSDAQVAEAVIKSEVSRLLGFTPKRPEIPPGRAYHYQIPDWIEFETQPLIDILEDVRKAKFKVKMDGAVALPKELEDAVIPIGAGRYRMGIGGLHSTEKCQAALADDETILVDRDVTSYYPAIIINQKLFPKQMDWAFLKVYKRIVARRLAAKKSGDKTSAETLKIVINGSFGKFGSRWSSLYAPDLLIQVTITGQLALLMLIERLHLEGIPVASANTDGIVIACPKRKANYLGEVIGQWELDTDFATEETAYRALYSRDVNNYIAIKPDGTFKGKGVFAEPEINKNAPNRICVEAAVAHIVEGIPIRQTIEACRDITKFVTVRTVNGGAMAGHLDRENGGFKPGARYLGKAIRWYYSTDGLPAIYYKRPNAKGTQAKVSRSEGAKPLMELPSEFPQDVDFGWYVRETRSILQDIAFTRSVI